MDTEMKSMFGKIFLIIGLLLLTAKMIMVFGLIGILGLIAVIFGLYLGAFDDDDYEEVEA